MNPQQLRRERILWAILAAAFVSGWLLIALLDDDIAGSDYRRILIALSLGTLFGQATLAATFTALGPGPLIRRLPLCLTWLVCLAFALIVNAWRYSEPNHAVILIATFGQWFLALLPLRAIVWRLRLGIHLESKHEGRIAGELQFGIRQLMILTAVIAMLLGTGRAIVPAIKSVIDVGSWHEAPVFAFVVTTNVVLTLPLALGILLRQRALLACGFGLLFVGLATCCELSLLRVLFNDDTSALDADIVALFWIMNYLQAAWVLAPLGILRLGGYQLTAGAANSEAGAN